MQFIRRAAPAARLDSSARLRLEQLETRDTPTVMPPGFSETVFASGLNTPTAMALAPDGRIFVAEKGGTLRVVQNGTVLSTPALTLTVDTFSERGLVGIAVDPNFATNHFIYVYYTTTTPVNRVSRFTVSGNTATGEKILLDNIPSTNGNHNGGSLLFGADGKLYIGVGESGVQSNAQTLANVAGKILRINSDGTIPADNPFVNTTGARAEIWALGLRNPFTMAVQPGTGRIFVNDVGGAKFEEINELVKGANYGWPTTEGDFDQASFPQFTRPVFAYAHGTGPLQGNTIAGGAFYNPANATFPAEYIGDYFFGEFGQSRIYLRDNSTGVVTTFAQPTAGSSPVDLDVLPDGRLLYLSLATGNIYQIAAVPIQVKSLSLIAAGTGTGTPSQISALNADGSVRFTTSAYAGYTGGVRVGSGDVTGDGVEDIITGTAPGAPPHVKVFDGATGGVVRSFFAFDPAFLGGVNVGAGDVNGDGKADIIVGAASGSSHVKVFDAASGAELRSFLSFPGFNGGVTVAAGDVTGDGKADIIVGTAVGSSHVKAFDGVTGATVLSFLAFDGFAGGVSVGFANGTILAGTATSTTHVKAFNASGATVQSFLAFGGFAGGVRVAGNGNTIYAGVGPGAGPHLKGFDLSTGALVLSEFVFDPSTPGGIFVG